MISISEHDQVLAEQKANLNIKLSKCIEKTIRQTRNQPRKVQYSNPRCSHHDNIGNKTENASDPQCWLPPDELVDQTFLS